MMASKTEKFDFSDDLLIPPFPPRRKKPVGNLGFLWAMWSNPVGLWAEAAFKEDIVAGPTIRGYSVLINAQEGIQHSFVKHASKYCRDKIVTRVLEPALGQGLFTAEGEKWRKQRRILAPIFSPRNISKLTDKMHDVSAGFMDDLVEKISRSKDQSIEVDFSEAMTRLTFYILSNTLFSGDIALRDGSENQKKSIQENEEEFFDAITAYIESVGHVSPMDILNLPSWVPRLSQWRLKKPVEIFNTRVDNTISKRQERVRFGEDVPDDLLTLLLKAEDEEIKNNGGKKGLSDQEIKDNIMTFIGAGHETTARAMTWVFYLISQQPKLMKALRAEVDAVMEKNAPTTNWLDEMVLCRAAIEETMRLYPPAPILIREALEDDETLGEKIPKDTVTLISTFVLHRHEKFWQNSNAFMPQRFMPENRDKISRHSYLPFGVGPRICIGAQFALQEAVIILATLIKRLDIEFIGKNEPKPVQRLTLRADGEVMMRVKLRD